MQNTYHARDSLACTAPMPSSNRPATLPALAVAGTLEDAKVLAQMLAQALAAAGHPPTAVPHSAALVHLGSLTAPDLLVMALRPPDVDLVVAWLETPAAAATTVLLVGATLTSADLQRLAQAGAAGWIPSATQPPALAAALAGSITWATTWAQAGRSREAALRDECAQLRAQLDDRKWVERAKGLLMDARSISEDEAFRLLRNTAMQAQLRLPEVARSIVDVARWADAINRAGQLRMLSQRLVVLAAHRPAPADGQLNRHRQALKRAQDNVDFLATLPLDNGAGAARAAVEQAWAGLKPLVGTRRGNVDLVAADAAAEALLNAAEGLTGLLETLGTRPTLRLVNLCGRQRMRCQRLAKEALLSVLQPEASQRAGNLVELIQAFEQAQHDIEAAPLSSPEFRQALLAARDGWLVLMRAVRSQDTVAIVSAGEQLLDQLDHLTVACEHSLQLLLS